MCPGEGDEGDRPDNVTPLPKGRAKSNGDGKKRDDVGPVELPDNVVELPREMWRRPNFLPTDLALTKACLDAGVGDDFRFSPERRDWRMWDGTRWLTGADLHLLKRIGDLFAEIGGTVRGLKSKQRVESTSVLDAVERRTRAELFKAETEFDGDQFLLNTPAGTVRLAETPIMLPHRREDYCTMMTTVAPGGECPGWLDFLFWMTRNDAAMVDYLQRLCGYMLCGSTREQMFAFLYGRGANGKSVFMKVIAEILGTYAMTAGMNTFVEQMFERHPEEIARMKGKRLVVASETDEGKRWNEALMKRLTGHGEKVTARGMRENSFEFEVQATIIFAGNHQPELSNVDPALARRVQMIPCVNVVAKDDIDKSLGDKLLAEEAGGILQWMIDGFAIWLRDGLNPPEVVREATAEYLEEQDWKSDWLRETFEREPAKTMWLASAVVYATANDYCKVRGLKPPSIKSVSKFLIASGWEKRDRTTGRGFVGWWYSTDYLAAHPHLTSGHSVHGEPEFWSNR